MKLAQIKAVVGQRIRELREERDFTQRDLAVRMETLGHRIDRSAIVRIEQTTRRVSVPELLVIAAALEVSPLDLLIPNDGTVEVGDVSLPSADVKRWLEGKDGKTVLRSLVHLEAEAFVHKAKPGDTGWADELATAVLANEDLLEIFEEATRETPKRRTFLMHMVMSTAAHGEWNEGETK